MAFHSLKSLSYVSLGCLLSTTFAYPSAEPLNVQQYDYIIVGGGLTGLVVANRLSELRDKTVLVIENGYIDNSPATLVPSAANDYHADKMYDIQSAPDAKLGNAKFAVAVGNVVGGGSVVNGMAFDRAAEGDYDAWETLGNNGWGWRDLLYYFKKSTTFTPPSKAYAQEFGITYDASYYGKTGPIQASYPPFQYPDEKNIWKAWKAQDINFPKEHASGDAVGAYWVPNSLNPKTETRSHARNSYFDPIVSRKNLKLLTGQRVNEILFKGLTANGVQMVSRADNKTTKVYAKKEVILAAGAIFTPHLLQLSGLGPKDILKAANIKVKKDIPGIGANFQDHPTGYMIYDLKNLSFPNPNDLSTNATFNATAWQEYQTSRTGPYTQAHGNSLAFLPLPQVTKSWKPLVSAINAQNTPTDFLPAIYKSSPALLRGFKAQRAIISKMLSGTDAAVGEIPMTPSGFVINAMMRPLSRGTVYLDPKDAGANPVVTYNTFQNPIDSKLLVTMIRWTRSFWSSPALGIYSPTEILPGVNAQTDEEIMEALLKAQLLAPSFSHPSGTCAMMPEALGGVVDSELRVYGVKGLRVVDASVLPLIPATHLQASMYAVAEKASDAIKKEAYR
ncbi:choline dehydrogenase-like protein [Delitschia confertaspora ATCC 74209]|uniref:Choline dehydrogenase-like protein n=1 Tax=Delitschia confertaspora ATCC 74209 TaxID=1513339 RepID=A0A9P4JX20_9PLEO|nr:choline dehydrogenase-like protein [Delitschia confertaspora ATCC 74209]